MFKRSFQAKERPSKVVRQSAKRSYREHTKLKSQLKHGGPPTDGGSNLVSPIITVVVGHDARLFACHEDIICLSPFFAAALKDQFYQGVSKRIELPEQEAEVFSSILEYLYKGDYYPRLLQDKKRNTWALEGPEHTEGHGYVESQTVYHHNTFGGNGGLILKDTAVYCAAEKFGLEELKRLALRKQGLQTGIQVDVILRSARFAYENTPDQDAKLRAHYLALIIRSRKTFKRSGTMQMEMEIGGSKLFFDLFVAMCNHIDDIVDATNSKSPKVF